MNPAIGTAPIRWEDGQQPRVVIVDDEPQIRLLVRRILERSAAARVVGEASDGEEAIRVVTVERPDALFLDVDMPLLDGFEALPELQRCSPNTRVVLLSGFDGFTPAMALHARGADDVVEKGLDAQAFAARVVAVCDPTNDYRPDRAR